MDKTKVKFKDIHCDNATSIRMLNPYSNNNGPFLDDIVESNFTEEVIRTIVVTGCATLAGFAFSYYIPVIAFQLGYRGSLFLSKLLFPSPTSLAYYSIILPRAVHAGCYCYSSPVIATAITSTSSAVGAVIGKGIVDLYFNIDNNYFADTEQVASGDTDWVLVSTPQYFKPSIRVHRWRIVRWIGKKVHLSQIKSVMPSIY
jgi:hypothetical protein